MHVIIGCLPPSLLQLTQTTKRVQTKISRQSADESGNERDPTDFVESLASYMPDKSLS